MAATRISIETFLSYKFKYPVIDVRSEAEFAHACIPGAVSLPLFNNEERKIVGTAYKQQSKQQAIKIGLSLFGKKMVEMVEFVEKLFENRETGSAKTVVVHCWRGGMRSGGVSWLLDLYGFKVFTLIGGYKAFRRWGIEQCNKDYPIQILGGYTGSGKTYVLQELKKQNQVTIDLEDLAKHKGSAFGSIGMPKQPSQEMFENLLALELHHAAESVGGTMSLSEPNTQQDTYSGFGGGSIQIGDGNAEQKVAVVKRSVDSPGDQLFTDSESTPAIWLEDESQRIGLVNIPIALFKRMRNKPVYFLDIPFEERLKHIVSEYGKGDLQELEAAIIRIQKRLGGLETKTAIKFLNENNLVECFRILLKYYDKQYLKGLHSRDNLDELLHRVECETVDAERNASHIFAKKIRDVYN